MRWLGLLLMALAVSQPRPIPAAAKAASTPPGAQYITFAQAGPVLQVFSDELPPDLAALSAAQLQAHWPEYVRRREHETRLRLRRGDEDSLANLLLYGTSFTSQPRITAAFLQQAGGTAGHSPADNAAMAAFLARVDDFIRALGDAGGNERIAQMRNLLAELGYGWTTAAERVRLHAYLVGDVARLRQELQGYEKQVEAARATGNVDQEFAARSTLFHDRGVSLDTSLMPDFAIEQAMRQLRDQGLLRRGSVRRVAIVGPGLDFTDKREGYDFYPLQSTQPFMVMDSLKRLDLSTGAGVQVTTLDISARVNQHLERARQRALRNLPYTMQLPLDPGVPWTADALAFWRGAGSAIGATVPPLQPPAQAGKLEMRAVRVPTSTVLRVHPADLNVVWQRLPLSASDKYDLVVATNILVYYNEFEQALTLDNLQEMVRPGGFLLTNNGLPEVPTLKMKQLGHSTTQYSERTGDGDHIIWYQNAL